MEIPQEFTERLNRDFDGRLRVKWSNFSKRYRIEQRAARGQMWPDKPILENDDEQQMIRDGYFFVMDITPGDKTQCAKCNTWLNVPIREVRIIACPVCKMMGRTYRMNLGFFPLTDSLIDYLKGIDPERGLPAKAIEKMRSNNEQQMLSMQRSMSNNGEAYGKENFNRIVGIPQFGHTGKETSWEDAPVKQISNERQKQGIAYKEQWEKDGEAFKPVQSPTIVVAKNH
jgi:hypothetical protein